MQYSRNSSGYHVLSFDLSYQKSPNFCMSSRESPYTLYESHTHFSKSRAIFSFP